MEAINIFSAIAGAIGIIVSFFIAIWKLFKKIDTIQEEFTENTIATLRLTIVNEHLPMDERIHAGEKYISMGGNGSVKKIVNQLIEEHAEELIH